MSIKRLILVGMYTLFLNACGGGGGSDDAVNQAPSGAVDTTPPVITLLGESPMTVEQGQAYEEPGATAEDDVDGAVEVIIEGEVERTSPETMLFLTAHPTPPGIVPRPSESLQ